MADDFKKVRMSIPYSHEDKQTGNQIARARLKREDMKLLENEPEYVYRDANAAKGCEVYEYETQMMFFEDSYEIWAQQCNMN